MSPVTGHRQRVANAVGICIISAVLLAISTFAVLIACRHRSLYDIWSNCNFSLNAKANAAISRHQLPPIYDELAPPATVAVVTYEDRTELDFFQLQQRIMAEYCRRHAPRVIHHVLTQRQPHWPVDLPPWWVKLWALRDVLPTADIALWLDSDAVVTNHRQRVEGWFPAGKHCVMARDHGGSALNAGVVAVRNSQEGRQILDELCASFDPQLWQSRTRWRGGWAGVAFEQGQMNLYFRRRDRAAWLHVLPWHVWGNNQHTEESLGSADAADNQRFISHIYGETQKQNGGVRRVFQWILDRLQQRQQ
jgi:hypothetical protein